MTDQLSSEFHVLDQIEEYLTGGLTPAEREAFEAHVAACAACATALGQARAHDAALRELFGPARPEAGMEDRVIRRLRLAAAPRRTLLHPLVRRAGLGVAAAVTLAALGYHFNQFEETGRVFAIRQVPETLKAIAQVPPQRDTRMFDGYAHRGLIMGNSVQPAEVQPLEKQARELADQGKFGEAAQVTDQIHSIDPGNTYAYYYGREYKLQSNLWGLQPRKDGVVRGQGETPADAPVSGGGSAGAEGKSLGAVVEPNAAFGLAYKPGEQLATLNKQMATGLNGPAGGGFGGGAGGGQQAQNLGRILTAGADDRSKADEKQAERKTGLAIPQAGAAVQPQGAQRPATAQQEVVASVRGRKIIRNGEMEFEVARFDDAEAQVMKIAAEEGGFVATTDSDKLPNGKTKGTVTVRVPPDHLDTLVLKLRGIGDLKSQKIGAQDVTKQYTDLESGLRAAQAMQERLLDIIKNGKGEIKDLLEAEKQLGTWREKIEQIQGEIRYYDNLVSLSTLAVTLFEKDIQTPASASETEQVTMSLETESVEDAYAKARSALSDAKARILQSELKQYDAGQYAATLKAAVPPDAAEALIARLKQLAGRVAHFSREKSQTTANANSATLGPLKVQREDVVVSVQIYNLANIAPRRTTNLTIAAEDVEKAYQQILDDVRSAGGRVVTSGLSKPKPDQAVASITVQVPTTKADAALISIRDTGEVIRQETVENPDTQNVTEAKRGFVIAVQALAATPARETRDVKLAAASVPDAFNQILEAARAANAHVISSQLNEQDRQDVTGLLELFIPRSAEQSFLATMNKSAQLIARTVTRAADDQNAVDTKVHLVLRLGGADKLPPRQTITERVEVGDVEKAADDLVATAVSAGGREIGNSGINVDRTGHASADVTVEVPLAKAGAITDLLDREGNRRGKQVAVDASVPEGGLSRARIVATFSNSAEALGGEETTWDAVRHALTTSGRGLRVSLEFLVIGFCLVAPWALVLWAGWKLTRRRPKAAAAPAVA